MFPIKLAKTGGASLAQVDDGTGPKFGSDGLVIPLNSANPKLVRCKLGAYYERMPDGAKSLLPNRAAEDTLTELKVYTGVYANGESIPFSTAEPLSLA